MKKTNRRGKKRRKQDIVDLCSLEAAEVDNAEIDIEEEDNNPEISTAMFTSRGPRGRQRLDLDFNRIKSDEIESYENKVKEAMELALEKRLQTRNTAMMVESNGFYVPIAKFDR